MGQVVDTNDPHQMGRLRVLCPAFGDSRNAPVTTLAWASYASPFAGATDLTSRGRSNSRSAGPVAYGMWNIPKVGSYVLVTCIDGDPNARFWFASVFPEFLAHTLPHGRYSYNGELGAGTPEGPLSSTESLILPLAANQLEAFTNQQAGVDPQMSFEWRTRAADAQASFVNSKYIGANPGDCDISEFGDDRNISYTEADGNTIVSNQGYGKSRIDPELTNPITDGTNWDSQTYAWVTPGFHGISMDDRDTNCRMRLRTAGGHQIIMDDTNERIYISTAQGKTWIEIDEKGTIDIFSEQDFSVRAKGDINFKTDKAFRVTAEEGIHLSSYGEMRLRSSEDLHIRTDKVLRLRSLGEMRLDSQANFHLITKTSARISTGSTLNLSAGANMLLSASPNIYLNGPPAQVASQAEEKEAFVPSRIPDHEPWPRVYTDPSVGDQDDGNQIQLEYEYDDPNVGKGSNARGIVFTRNSKWHR
jgi:hypothetical protein